jgi:hypothetical protein
MSAADRGSAGAPLSVAELQERIALHVYAMYMNYAFLIKGGVYTVAALSLFHILTDQSTSFRFGLLVFWGASFAFSLVTFSKWSRGAAMINARANMFDVLLPIGIAIPEYLMFIVIDPEFGKTGSSTVWYVIFSSHATLAFMLVLNRLQQTVIVDDYSTDMRPLPQRYVSWLRGDLFGTAIAGILSLLIFIATTGYGYNLLAMPGAALYHEIIAIVICLAGLIITWEAYYQYNEIVRFKPALNQTPA